MNKTCYKMKKRKNQHILTRSTILNHRNSAKALADALNEVLTQSVCRINQMAAIHRQTYSYVDLNWVAAS